MYFFKGLLLASTCLWTMVNAACFSTGEIWDNKQNAISKLDGVCEQLKGQYQSGVTRRRCRQGFGQKYDFIVDRTSGNDGFLSKKKCINKLKNEINGCDRGGRSPVDGFTFTSDPNTGPC